MGSAELRPSATFHQDTGHAIFGESGEHQVQGCTAARQRDLTVALPDHSANGEDPRGKGVACRTAVSSTAGARCRKPRAMTAAIGCVRGSVERPKPASPRAPLPTKPRLLSPSVPASAVPIHNGQQESASHCRRHRLMRSVGLALVCPNPRALRSGRRLASVWNASILVRWQSRPHGETQRSRKGPMTPAAREFVLTVSCPDTKGIVDAGGKPTNPG